MIANQNAQLDKPWGLGWAVGENALYDGASAKVFGHSGATGTLCWADPDRKLTLCSSRTGHWTMIRAILAAGSESSFGRG
jgi:hypothetical protein